MKTSVKERPPQAALRQRILHDLERWGLLLLQDPKLPSVVTIIVGEPVRGSWWAHPKGGTIFNVFGEIEDHPDVLTAKLIAGKVTLVHRRQWRALATIGLARERWQMRTLTPEARRLLETVDGHGRVRASGKAAKLLEQALLVASELVHTESGAHALELTSWKAFARREKLVSMPYEQASAELEHTLNVLNDEFGTRATLPWQRVRPAGLPR